MFQELQEDEEPCYGKKCTANEHCCPGSVCVDVDGSEYKIQETSLTLATADKHTLRLPF